jgi:hypothetical protein
MTRDDLFNVCALQHQYSLSLTISPADERLHRPWSCLSCRTRIPNGSHPRHLQSRHLYCPNRSSNPWKSGCFRPCTRVRSNHSWRCPGHPVPGWHCWCLTLWNTRNRNWWTQWRHHCSLALTIELWQIYQGRDVRETRTPHPIWWWWSCEGQGWSGKCDVVYGFRWSQVHQRDPPGIEWWEGCCHTYLRQESAVRRSGPRFLLLQRWAWSTYPSYSLEYVVTQFIAI